METQHIINVWKFQRIIRNELCFSCYCHAFTMDSFALLLRSIGRFFSIVSWLFYCDIFSLCSLSLSVYGFLFFLSLPFCDALSLKFNSQFHYHTCFFSSLPHTSIWISFELYLIVSSISFCLCFGRSDGRLVGWLVDTMFALPVCSELKLLFPFIFWV